MRNPAVLLAMIPICLMEFLTTQDFAIVNAALTGIATQFRVPVTELHWVLSAQLLTIGALLVPAGIAGNRYGRKPVFVAGLILAACGNVLLFLAPSFALLVAARLLIGVGVATMASIVLALVADLTPLAADRDRALSAIAVAQLVGLPTGALFGGMLLARFGWRYAFLLNAALATVTIPLAMGLLPKSSRVAPEDEAPLDVAGLLLIALLSTLLVWTVSRQSAAGLLSCAALMAALAWVERRAAQPILPGSILRLSSFVRACGLIALVTCLNTGLIFTLSLHLQRSGGSPTAMTWTVFVPMAIGSLIGTWLIPRCLAKVSRTALILAGLGVDALLVIATALLAPAAFRYLPATMLLVSVCMLFIFVPAQAQALADAPMADRGVASSLIRMSYNLPTGIGIAAVAASLAAGGDRLALLTAAAFGVAGLLVVALTPGPSAAAAPVP